MKSFFEDLKKGLEEAIAQENGEKVLRSRVIEIPEKSIVDNKKNADDRTRTSTWLPRVDFESTASTIPPHRQKKI